MSNNPSGRMPNNPLTRMLEDASRMRVEGRREVPVNSGDLPSARSASIGRIVTDPPPLSPAEKEELDAKARELGLLPPEGTESSNYVSQEAALQAGAPVERLTATEVIASQGGFAKNRQPASFGGGIPRLPDFTKVEGIDLLRNVIYVDSMEFSIPKVDADEFRLYAIRIARETITKKLNDAMAALNAAVATVPTEEVMDGGAVKAVLAVQGDEGVQGVS